MNIVEKINSVLGVNESMDDKDIMESVKFLKENMWSKDDKMLPEAMEKLKMLSENGEQLSKEVLGYIDECMSDFEEGYSKKK